MDPKLSNAYRFHFANGGYIVGKRAECALRAARAERWLEDHADDYGLTVIEQADDDTDLGDHEYWCAAARTSARGIQPYARQYGRCEHYAVSVAIVDSSGQYLASLGGILDPTPEYIRVIVAELADEVRGRLEIDKPDVVLSEN